jgi:hypothetical protein
LKQSTAICLKKLMILNSFAAKSCFLVKYFIYFCIERSNYAVYKEQNVNATCNNFNNFTLLYSYKEISKLK